MEHTTFVVSVDARGLRRSQPLHVPILTVCPVANYRCSTEFYPSLPRPTSKNTQAQADFMKIKPVSEGKIRRSPLAPSYNSSL